MRRSLPAVLAAIAFVLSGCASEEATTSISEEPTVDVSGAASSLGATPPTANEESGAAATLGQEFSTPDGLLSFRYPTGWNVTPDETGDTGGYENAGWEIHDDDGQLALSLSVQEWRAPAGPPPLESVLPQGSVPGVLDGLGNPVQTVVAGTPGHDGSSTGVVYGLAAGTGADTSLFELRWGNTHLLSLSGGLQLGPYDQVDLAAETQEFAEGMRFQQEILPILQSLTVGPPPPVTSGSEASDEAFPDNFDAESIPDDPSAGMTFGDIDRWAEDLEDGYLAEDGYSEFADAPTNMVQSLITTFHATTYGELQVLVPAWTTDDEADAIVSHVSYIVAELPDAPHIVSVRPGGDEPALATQPINW
ncbi:hypothetical protein [Kocuria rosea]|uniref:hypothetical protein n=1 Tax=Kocuria rosea TaxID=1275 RepID=UPI00232EF62E|nr:hypothetical protein [Kocuria rosea]